MRTNIYIYLALSLFISIGPLSGQGWVRFASNTKAIPTADGNFLNISAGLVKASPEAQPIWRSLLIDSSAYSTDTTAVDITDAFIKADGNILAGGQILYRAVDEEGTPSSGFYRAEAYWVEFNSTGSILMENTRNFGVLGGRDEIKAMVPSEDGGAILYGYYDFPYGVDDTTVYTKMLLAKIDANGNFLWQQDLTTPTSTEEFGKAMINLPDGTYTLLGHRREGFLNRTLNLINIDTDGNINWETAIDDWTLFQNFDATSFTHCPDGGYFLADKTGPGFPNQYPRVVKTDAGGHVEWSHTFADEFPGIPQHVALAIDDGYLVTGTLYETPERRDKDIFFRKYNLDGTIAWTRIHGGPGNDRGAYILYHPEGGYILPATNGGFNQLTGRPSLIGVAAWFRTDSLGHIYSNEINGNVFEDFDLDCTYFGEEGLPQWIVAREGNGEIAYTVTDPNGAYAFPSDSGTYTLSLPNKAPYWDGCIDPVETVLTALDTNIVDLPQHANVECPYLEVDISTPFLRRCFENDYTVSYCNRGTLAAEDAYVEVALDPYLSYVSSTIPLLSNVDNLLTFEIGYVDLNACGDFKIRVLVDCDSTVLGQTHCVNAHIYPDSLCVEAPLWTGASLDISANCQGDSVLFVVTNVGTAPTSGGIQYLVIEDQVILREGAGPVLLPGANESFVEPAFGATLRLEVEQEPNHPGSNRPSISVEGCSTDGHFDLGYVTQYWENDGDPFVSIDCQENIGSFDPNDKRAYPSGYGEEHFIEANEDIEYHIRFQNTGTDTAFTVVVRDLISVYLDIGTIRPGASSHPFEWEIVDERVLQFTFSQIDLVDSLTNEPLSHGFIKFRIEQYPDLPNGIRIENTAAIFFDFNEPVITNTTFHTIGENFVVSLFTPEDTIPNLSLHAWPNPFSEQTTIELTGWEGHGQLDLFIFDALGRQLRHQKSVDPKIIFQRGDLPSGLYFFKLAADGHTLSNGKLMIQSL